MRWCAMISHDIEYLKFIFFQDIDDEMIREINVSS